MIYDFEGHTPKMDPKSWVASNSVIIGKVELKKNSNIWFNVTLRGDVEPITVGEVQMFKMVAYYTPTQAVPL